MTTKLLKKFEDAFIMADYLDGHVDYYAVYDGEKTGHDLQRLNDQVRIVAGVPLQEFTTDGPGTGTKRIERPWLDKGV